MRVFVPELDKREASNHVGAAIETLRWFSADPEVLDVVQDLEKIRNRIEALWSHAC
jgi:hypothetical protein